MNPAPAATEITLTSSASQVTVGQFFEINGRLMTSGNKGIDGEVGQFKALNNSVAWDYRAACNGLLAAGKGREQRASATRGHPSCEIQNV